MGGFSCGRKFVFKKTIPNAPSLPRRGYGGGLDNFSEPNFNKNNKF
jgi:hypothetical protein